MKIRAFIAVDPSAEVTKRLGETIRLLERKTTGFRWVRPEAMHLTLRFLGDIEDGLVETIDARLAQLAMEFSPMTLNAGGLGFFPGPEKPRVLWAGLAGEIQRLEALQRKIHLAVAGLPVHREEDRAFHPHLTLARIPHFRGASGISSILQAAPEEGFGTFEADRFFLYKSRLTPEGASYTKLKDYLLRRP